MPPPSRPPSWPVCALLPASGSAAQGTSAGGGVSSAAWGLVFHAAGSGGFKCGGLLPALRVRCACAGGRRDALAPPVGRGGGRPPQGEALLARAQEEMHPGRGGRQAVAGPGRRWLAQRPCVAHPHRSRGGLLLIPCDALRVVRRRRWLSALALPSHCRQAGVAFLQRSSFPPALVSSLATRRTLRVMRRRRWPPTSSHSSRAAAPRCPWWRCAARRRRWPLCLATCTRRRCCWPATRRASAPCRGCC